MTYLMTAPYPGIEGSFVGVRENLFNSDIIVFNDDEVLNWWTYPHNLEAMIALADWEMLNYDGEPQDWVRHALTGRRRPGGDKEKEYIAL